MAKTEERQGTAEERLLEERHAKALALSKKEGKASCWQWMHALKIGYAEASKIMDLMEQRGEVAPIRYRDGVPESSGPRKLR
jgi:DNA segregation ATPase FtsK/SpoIIIE-like protein